MHLTANRKFVNTFQLFKKYVNAIQVLNAAQAHNVNLTTKNKS